MAWPASPTNGQQTTINGTTFQYDAANTVWNRIYTTVNSGIQYVGQVSSNAQPNITSVGTLTSLSVTGNITGGNLIGTLANGNSNVSIPASNGNVTVSVTGTSNIAVFTSTGVNVAGYISTTSNVTAGNISGGNLVTVNFLNGTIVTSASSQPNITSVSSSFTGLTFTSNGNITLSGASSQMTGANLVSASYVNASYVTATTGNITGNLVVSNYANAANITVANLVANTSIGFANAWLTEGQTTEVINNLGAVAATPVTCNLSIGATFYHTSVSLGSNWTVNFTNVPTTTERSIVATIIVVQGATPYAPTAVQIDGVGQTIKWISGTSATGTPSGVDAFSFALLRSGGTWVQVLGTYSGFV